MKLEYTISANDSQMRRVLRGVEAEAKSMSRRVARDAQASPVANARRASVAATSRAEQAAAKALERQRLQAIKSEGRAKLAADRNVSKAAEQLDRQRSRGLMQQYKEQERAAARVSEASARTVRSIRSGAARSVMGGIGTVAKIGGAALGVIGGFSAAGALEEQLSIKRSATQVALSAGDPTQKAALEKEALGVKGFTGTETLGSLGGFVQKTGDLAAGRADIQTLGKLALASSSDFGEMGEAAGQAFNVIRDTIKDPVKQVEALNDVLRTLVGQGQLGAVEIKDMTTELAGLGAASRAFVGNPVEMLKTMGAMAQASVARGGSRDAAEATTAVSRFAADLTKHQGQQALTSLGVNVFADNGRTKLKDPKEIVGDLLEKTHGDLVKVEEVLNAESKKALAGFSPLFIDAEKKKKGTGRAAVMAEFDRFNSATPSMDEIEKRASLRLADPDLQIKEAMKSFNAAVGSELVPVITRAIPKFVEAIPAIAKFTEGAAKAGAYLLDNPFKGMGAIVLASVAKDIAGAGLGAFLRQLLTSAMGGGGAGASAAGAGGAAGLAGLAAVLGVGAAVDQAQGLAKASGGWAGVYAGVGGVLAGRGYAGGVDDYMNDQARDASSFAPAPTAQGPGAAGWWGANPPAAPPSAPTQGPGEWRKMFEAHGADLKAAAQEFRAAAKDLKVDVSVKGMVDAGRHGPINTR